MTKVPQLCNRKLLFKLCKEENEMGRIAYFGRRNQDANAFPVAPNGNEFNLKLVLNARAPQDIEVRLIPQKIVFDIGGFSDLERLNPDDYFSQQPNVPFVIRQNQAQIVIGPYRIKSQNVGNPLILPQDILFTSYIPVDLNDPFGVQESRTHCVSIAESLRNVIANEAQEFEGSSNTHDYHEALDAAIAAAKNGLRSTLIKWRITEESGEDGGFAQVHRLTIRIAAWTP